MSENNYFTFANVTFPSEGDYKLWAEKVALFNSEKAMNFLQKSGQVNFSCIRVNDDNVIRILIVWEYADEASFQRCQELWAKWGDVAGDFISKITFHRGSKFYGW